MTLVLPWTAFRYVQEMEAALRGGLEQSLIASASTVAAALEEQTTPLCASVPCVDDDAPARGTTIYAAPLAAEPRLDGVHDDWSIADDVGVAAAPVAQDRARRAGPRKSSQTRAGPPRVR